MKNSFLPDFVEINTMSVGYSKLTQNNSSKVPQDSINLNDSVVPDTTQTLVSDSIVRDSSFISVDTISKLDTIQQAIEKPEPKFGGEQISRFQDVGLGNDWFVGVILFSAFLLASVKFLFRKYLSKLVESIFNYHTANNLFLDKNINMIKGSVIVNLLFIVNISLFAINVINFLNVSVNQENGFKEFMLIFAGILLLYIGKVIVIRSLGYIFKGQNESKEYVFTTFLYNKNLGLFLFPVIIALPFVQTHAVEWLVNIGLFMIVFFYILRIGRGLKILFRKHVSIFYMILYLCALEIVPLLMIYSLLVG